MNNDGALFLYFQKCCLVKVRQKLLESQVGWMFDKF